MTKHYRIKFYFIILVIMLICLPTSIFGQGVSEEARRYIARGVAAIEMAKTNSDYIFAVQEFEQAAKLAPDCPEIYLNLGNVHQKLGDLTSAMKSYQRYLVLAPKSPEASKVQDDIYKLEYRLDRQKQATALAGTWIASNNQIFRLTLDGSHIKLELNEQQGNENILTIKVLGSTHTGPMTDVPIVFLGLLIGDKISGVYIQPGGRYSGYCDLPERKGNFEGNIDIAADRIRIVYNRVLTEYEMKSKSFLSGELVCRETNRKETQGYVLELKRKQE